MTIWRRFIEVVSFKKVRNTLMAHFTFWYVIHLFITMFIIGMIILVAASYFLINNIKKDTRVLEQQLLDASQEQQVDWTEAIDNLLYPNYSNYYVKVTDSKGKMITSSHGWDQISNTDYDQINKAWLLSLLFNHGKGVYFTRSAPWVEKNGSIGHITIYAQLNPIWDFLRFLIEILLTATLIGVLLGSMFIFFRTRRNLEPLKNITDTVKDIQQVSDFKKRVPIPDGPNELTTLANAFNRLLQKIEGQIEKERMFASNASHELRTPITAFKGHLNLLKRWGKKDPKVLDQSIHALESEGNRMQRLIDQLLRLAQSDSPYIETRPILLNQVIKQANQELLENLKPLQVIQVKRDENIEIVGNSDQIRQIAIIFIENAIKFTDKTGEIELSIYGEENWGVFEIHDSGIGIQEEDLPHIFERFYRIDKARSRQTGGTGLGLSIAKEMIDQHKGHIEVQSAFGEGTTFKVMLPKVNMPNS